MSDLLKEFLDDLDPVQKSDQSDQKQSDRSDQKRSDQSDQINTSLFQFNRLFLTWLSQSNISIIVSSYKTHQIFAIGMLNDPRDKIDKLSLWMSNYNRPMGLWVDQEKMLISSSGNLWTLTNSGKFLPIDGSDPSFFDANYVPRHAYFSSDVDVHDLCLGSDGQIYYCSALFSVICTPSFNKTFQVYWKPPWISKIAPEDRCHLNGLCCRDGIPRYVTSCSQCDSSDGWRGQSNGQDLRIDNGLVYDIVKDEIVCGGLTMPHSPRWHNGKLWILDSGTGHLGFVNFETKQLERVVFIPGFLRGLSFVGDRYAIVGSSKDRHELSFNNLPLKQMMEDKKIIESLCGFCVIDLDQGFIIHKFSFMSPVDELYDVRVIRGMKRPKLTDVGDQQLSNEYHFD